MTRYKYDLAVCWRIYPGVSKDPIFFKEDKFKLAQLSFHSFLKSAEGIRVKYFIVMDGCPSEFDNIFSASVPAEDMEFIRTDHIGNLATFEKQLDILSIQEDADLVYFAEDDYLYRPLAFADMIRFFKTHKPVDFITPYDHLDYYEHPVHLNVPETKAIVEGGVQWKQVVSTCLSFLTSKKVLAETMPVLETYLRENTDGSLWMTLTRKYGPGSLIKFRFSHKETYFIMKKAMKYNFRKFVAGKRYHLWCPVPSIATHLESKHIAPGVDWEKVKAEVEKQSLSI